MHDRTGGQPAHAFERLEKLLNPAVSISTGGPIDRTKLDALIRKRVESFYEDPPDAGSKEEAIGLIVKLITDSILDPKIRAILA